MAWDAGTITSPIPSTELSEKLQALCGGEGVANWSFVETMPAGSIIGSVQTLVLSDWGAGDSFTITWYGETTASIPYASNIASALDAAIGALPSCSASFLTVTRTDVNTYVFTLSSTLGGTHEMMTVNGTGCTGIFQDTTPGPDIERTGQSAYCVDVFKCAGTGDDANDSGKDWYFFIARYDVDEIQTVNLTSWSEGDTFRLTYNTHETGDISYSADCSAAIKAALEALADFEDGDITVTQNSVSSYYISFGGTVAHTNVGNLTVTNPSGCTGSIVQTLTGSADATSIRYMVAEQYDKGMVGRVCMGNSLSASVGTDDEGYVTHSTTYYYSTRRLNVINSFASISSIYYTPTLNSAGFNYQIKLDKNFVMISTRVGTTDSGLYAGLMDSAVNASMEDDVPLVMLTPSATVSFFHRIPGVLNAYYYENMSCVVADAWTSTYSFGSNAANVNDKWQLNKIHVYRIMCNHDMTSAETYLYGGFRGLLKKEVLGFYAGGTVVMGDTMNVGEDAYTVMFKHGNHYFITQAN
jgi:hypothetical protein